MAGRTVSPLGRQKARRAPYRRFTLFCEGQNTESAYFRALQAKFPGTMVDITIVPAAGVPMTIAQKATGQKIASRRKKDSYEKNDEIWAVFDRDTHPNHTKAVDLCESHGVGVARSDPCFEVWLILHRQEYDKFGSSDDAQRFLQGLCPEYDRRRQKTPDCHRLLGQLTEAEHRAERQLAARAEEGKAFGPPSTTVFHLTRAIAEAAAQSKRI